MSNTFFEINAKNTSYFRIMTNGAALIACTAMYFLQPISEHPLIINSLLLSSGIVGVRNLCEAALDVTQRTSVVAPTQSQLQTRL